MTKREVAALAVKVLGLYVIGSALGQLYWLGMLVQPSYVSEAWGTTSKQVQFLLYLAPFVLVVLYGLILWLDAHRLGARMTRGEDAPVGETRMTAAELQTVAVSAVGLVILGTAVPSLARVVVWIGRDGWEELQTPWNNAELVATSIHVLFGLWLLLGAQGLTRLLRNLWAGARHVGKKIREPSWAKLYDETDGHEPEEDDDRPTHEQTEPDPDHDRPDAGGLPQ
jgi:hypothetical protein